MSEEITVRLQNLQRQIEFDAEEALNRNELNRLREYWGDIQSILDTAARESVQ